jgi:flagellar hook protein FlgE
VLNEGGVLGQTLEDVIVFRDINGVVRTIALKATCTKGETTVGAGDAEWQLEFSQNGQNVGASNYTNGSGLVLPTITLSDGTAVNLSSSGNTVTVDGSGTYGLNTYGAVPDPSGSSAAFAYNPAHSVNPVPHNPTVSYKSMSQYAGSFNLGSPYQDGYASGDLQDKTINAAGVIVGTYSNGQQLNLGQVALAIFNNQQGLERAGSTLFTQSNNSGRPNIGPAGESGRGTLQAGVLEMANVDLAEEFTNMIVTQRGYQSNSRVITTSDEMLQELMSLKR